MTTDKPTLRNHPLRAKAFYAYRERPLTAPLPPSSDRHPRLDYDRRPITVVTLDDAIRYAEDITDDACLSCNQPQERHCENCGECPRDHNRMTTDKPTLRKLRWHQCPGCWSVLLRDSAKDWECNCGELMANIDLRDAPTERVQAAVDASGRPTMNPHPDSRGVWQ